MRKQFFLTIMSVLPFIGMAQMATDVYQLSQKDMRGTARFMSMAGAFGALGGDISTLNQNPAGIGVYRSSDLAATLDLNFQSTSARSQGDNYGSVNKFLVSLNNAGYVGAYNINGESLKNLNWGITYNRAASFNRRYAGGFSRLNSSLSNSIAAVSNSMGLTTDDLATTNNFDPYLDSMSPWLSILAYDSYLINPQRDGEDFQGLFGSGTSGFGEFETIEEGGINEFSLNLGGNFSNILYWGLGVGINDITYKSTTYYGESLSNAYIMTSETTMGRGTADWGITNQLLTTGTGYNFKMGVIVKPINEIRLGFAFHTPTYYSLMDLISTGSAYSYNNNLIGEAYTNDGYAGESRYEIKTPWKFIASAATVIGGKAILSFDYEYVGYNTMAMSFGGMADDLVRNQVDRYYKASNIFRVGGEFRVTPQLSLRAGYSMQTSPIQDNLQNENIETAETTPSYMFDNSTQHITAGLGYKISNDVYFDFAYVHKNRKSEYHAYSPLIDSGMVFQESPTATITDSNNQLVFTLGLRF